MEKTIYRTLTKREIYKGLEVVYHPFIQSDSKARTTEVLSEVISHGKELVIQVKNESGCVFLESLELKSEFDKRKSIS